MTPAANYNKKREHKSSRIASIKATY